MKIVAYILFLIAFAIMVLGISSALTHAEAKPKPKKNQTIIICPRALPGHHVCYNVRIIRWLR